MNTKIKKINLNHSFIFFFGANIISILLFKYSNLNISTILCLLLILIIGVSHGSLDHIKGKKLLELFNFKINLHFLYCLYFNFSSSYSYLDAISIYYFISFFNDCFLPFWQRRHTIFN